MLKTKNAKKKDYESRYRSMITIVVILLMVVALILILCAQRQFKEYFWVNLFQLGITPFCIGILGFIINKHFYQRHESYTVNEIFTEELKKMGTIHFTGVTRILRSSFDGIKKPEDFRVGDEMYDTTLQMLFIGISYEFIPVFIKEDIVNSQPDNPIKVKALYNNSMEMARFRVASRADTEHTEEAVEKYYETNNHNYKQFLHNLKRHLNHENLEVKAYKAMPFGAMVSYGNYIWYAPLWNDSGVARTGKILEVRKESDLGRQILASFDALYNMSDLEK